VHLTGVALALTVLTAALGACARTGGGGEVEFSAEALGACDRGITPGDPVDALAQPGAWLRIESISGGKEGRYGGRFAVAGGDEPFVSQVAASPAPLTMSKATAGAIATALRADASVTVHTGTRGDARQVTFALAATDTDFAFLGRCANDLLTMPLTARLGTAAHPTLTGLVGKSATDIRAALTPRRPEPKSREVALHPGRAPEKLLASLRQGLFRLVAPAAWHGRYTVCTKLAQGWNDCVDLSDERTSAIEVGMYYDPKAPHVEVWLLDADATLSEPIALLGRVDLAALAKAAAADAKKNGVILSVSLADTPSLAAVVAYPASAAGVLKAAVTTS